MAKLPPSFSLQAIDIRSALSQGRTEDARRMVIELLLAGKADRVVQGIAADLLKPAKRSAGRPKALPAFWIEIGEDFHQMREAGVRYDTVLSELGAKYGFSESHIRNAISTYDDTDE
ncbi:hypothetical protein FHX06_003679 [Rhizobium sp. BK512]|uniref:hypothetical protein n=1 Tax=Rhizobium sp. BK512 TaxID=2587010 RepID=UPI0016128880|nr:hypothetical protein [Rhizobium sp. BK512]MBB3562348.1 hypothetical protein [Rhizobium sp. BK512]